MTLHLDRRFYDQISHLMPVSPTPIPTRIAIQQKLELARWHRGQAWWFGEVVEMRERREEREQR
jgi:hypothetical protein